MDAQRPGVFRLRLPSPLPAHCMQVTRAVVQLDPGSSPRGPLQVVPAWLALLSWVGDSRWRRLPAGVSSVWNPGLHACETALWMVQSDLLLARHSSGCDETALSDWAPHAADA